MKGSVFGLVNVSCGWRLWQLPVIGLGPFGYYYLGTKNK